VSGCNRPRRAKRSRRFLSDADQTFLGLIELPVRGSVHTRIP
jgi:hypothetical protein